MEDITGLLWPGLINVHVAAALHTCIVVLWQCRALRQRPETQVARVRQQGFWSRARQNPSREDHH